MSSSSIVDEKGCSTEAQVLGAEELSTAYLALKSQLTEQADVIAKKSDVITRQQARIDVLEELLQLNKIERFGASSEANVLQGQLFNEAELLSTEGDDEADERPGGDPEDDDAARKPRAGRKGLNPTIPRVQRFIYLSDAEREGAIDTFFVSVKEELDIVPAQVRVIEHMQEKAVYLDEQGNRQVVAAERPVHPLGKSVASVALLAYIIIGKYCDGMPLYRQATILKRYGGSITRGTMASWLIRLSTQLVPVVSLLREVQLSSDYLQCDETRLQVLKEHGMEATGDKWIWVVRGGPPDKAVVLFNYDKSRSGAVAKRLLDGFEGRYVQSDGYAGYGAAVDTLRVTQVGCFDHARRKFVKAVKAMPKSKLKKGVPAKCVVALSRIDALYAIERRMNLLELSDDERRAYRHEQAIPKLKTLHAWLIANESKVEKESLTYKAISYTLAQWSKLIAYCDHGQLRISNILAENAIRPFVIGRKAWLFSDTPAGANASALYYTLIETAKANQIDPYRYMHYLVSTIATASTVDDIEALLPWNAKAKLIEDVNTP